MLCPEADPSCKDPSRLYFLPSRPAETIQEASFHPGELLDPTALPKPAADVIEPTLNHTPPKLPDRPPSQFEQRRGQAYLEKVIANLEATPTGGRNNALNRSAWTLGRWVAAGALELDDVEDCLYRAALNIRLVEDDGSRQCWATIRSGLAAGLRLPVDLRNGQVK